LGTGRERTGSAALADSVETSVKEATNVTADIATAIASSILFMQLP
jgi:hypothetical protein